MKNGLREIPLSSMLVCLINELQTLKNALRLTVVIEQSVKSLFGFIFSSVSANLEKLFDEQFLLLLLLCLF